MKRALTMALIGAALIPSSAGASALPPEKQPVPGTAAPRSVPLDVVRDGLEERLERLARGTVAVRNRIPSK